jgi:TRAP-type C4-dicarboxylate transport system substrate-binding protein
MTRRLLWTLLALVCALALPSLARVAAASSTTIRLGMLAPAGSTWDKVFRAWNNTLTKQTGGAVNFQFFAGGVAGDERDVIRKMKLGQLDASLMTSVGLGQIARPTQVLQTPGILDNYEQLTHVREKLAGEFEALFRRRATRSLAGATPALLGCFRRGRSSDRKISGAHVRGCRETTRPCPR